MQSNGSRRGHQRSILATWMRSGTSKGLFILRDQLPERQSVWKPIILAIMGTGDQTDGIGGGTPTTSKVAVISRSTKPGFDVDYTFVQVDFVNSKLDMSGTCGNLAAGVGYFALDQRLVDNPPGQKQVDVKVFVENTGQALLVTIPIPQNDAMCDVRVTFVTPNGGVTGRLFPSGSRKDYLSFNCPSTGVHHVVESTLIDSANPFVLVDSASMPGHYALHGPDDEQSRAIVEAIRRAGSVRMGLARDLTDAAQCQGTPKIVVVAPSSAAAPSADVQVTAFSVGVLHPALQATAGICLAAALSISGTVPSSLLASSTACSGTCPHGGTQPPRMWRIAHRAGLMDTEIIVSWDGEGEYLVEKGSITRTVRKLFEGRTFY
ncbi:hypothetical protein HIM_05655 [Hirsutella minnesotensis 3608]|uniref:Isomerase YraM n=1 Tax=Hirsutella minnesotensis 3608 TaxID=1043627 RepID=A0A0F8A592_9HYPO|nr:hypothetical protein HIM_05655 [Hirsutella minnesotensis 3608]